MNTKPTILIFGILFGYLVGVLIFFYDNSSIHSSFEASFSHFPLAQTGSLINQPSSLATLPKSTHDAGTQLWFFREQPLFLIWAIMHVIGVALCFVVFLLNYHLQQTLQKVYKVSAKEFSKFVLIVLAALGLILWISYTTAYGFDYVAYLIPLNHAQVKIYSLEALNYLAGAYSLVNMMLICSLARQKATDLTYDEFTTLKKYFNTCLFMTAIVVAYATFASGVLYKALNKFYYTLYDPLGKSAPYFPVVIIITLGLINTFLLSMFYFPNAQVFTNLKKQFSEHLILSNSSVSSHSSISINEKPVVNFLGITRDMLDTIKVLLALLAPLLSGLFS